MAHVTLIRTAVLIPKLRPQASGNAIPPLGMAYIAGALSTNGVSVTCIDAPGEALTRFRECPLDPGMIENGLSVPEIIDRIPPTTEIVGITCLFSYDWFYVREFIRSLRERFADVLIVLGGEHATADFEYILRSTPEVDACVLGEGENKMLGLVRALERGISKLELPGVAVWDSTTGSVRKNPEEDGQYRVQDVNTIPRPAWDLLPIRKYLAGGSGYSSLHHVSIPMLASRGCPYSCTFCSSPQMWTTRWKARDVDDLIDEIKTYVRRYGINRVEFCDLTAIIDKRWTTEFCQRLLDEKIEITWAMPQGTRTEALTPDVLKLLRKSGCDKLSYPFETGNPKISALINKKLNYQRALASMKEALRAGIIVKAHLIIGFPFEGWADVFREYLFAVRLARVGCNDINVYNFSPYPGSELHKQLVDQGTIVKDESYPQLLRNVYIANWSSCHSFCPAISGRALRYLCVGGVAVFYSAQFLFRPQRLIACLYRMCTYMPRTALELGLTNMVRKKIRFWRTRMLEGRT